MAQSKRPEAARGRSREVPGAWDPQNGAKLPRAAFEPFEPLDDNAIHALPTRDVLDFEPIVGRSLTAGTEALEAERGPQPPDKNQRGD